ncbi:MAG: 2-oxoglutarate dehydrogenase E1 component [Bacteroidales bacterium]
MHQRHTKTMDKFSFLGNTDINTVEKLYKQYLENPEQLDDSWVNFFRGFEMAQKHFGKEDKDTEAFNKEFKVINLIEAYRKRGHLFTKTNPVRSRRKYSPTLDIENFGLTKEDLDTVFQAGNRIGIGAATLREIIKHLEQTYCRSIGAEYMFIRNPEIIGWLQEKMESSQNTPKFSPEGQKDIYHNLKQAVGFESFIHKKFVGQKRFSLEGAESLIPALDAVVEYGAELGIEEFLIGMSHRGRLNVLANIIKKPVEDIFSEFLGEKYDDSIALGDVKYHLGFGNEIRTDKGKKVRLNMAPNPSHLEAVTPVIQGIAKAKINNQYQKDYNKLAPISIHGDAAIAAQGVVYETIQMSQLPGYKTGGTIHLVINNQVGFTTNYLEGRSSTYCTDIGKVIKAPIFHVNGDDVEAMIFTIQLALEYRQKFHTDVFIDLLSYRKYGHNEGDEPRFTQPLLYEAISKHPNPRDIYGEYLVENGVCTKEELENQANQYNQWLDEKFTLARKREKVHIKQFLIEDYKSYKFPEPNDFSTSPVTGVTKKKLKELAKKINHLPSEKTFFKKVHKLIDERNKMITENSLDWGMVELLAYGSLADEGIPVRLSGQDSVRGTFSHRHGAFTIKDSDEKYFPLQHINKKQAAVDMYNSPLSEYGVLGFEYGYALAIPKGLTIWEAQFGDFNNEAQVIIDQYISSAEEKWGLMNGLTLYLPHGYEGQGPEHSSARMERFLTLAANNNLQVVSCTTPANFFHVLRRQVKRDFRIPLIIFTPKSLLRHKKAVSSLKDLSDSGFKEVIDDNNVQTEQVKRVVFCSGKIYYDLLERKEHFNATDIALIRIEQLYPFPHEQVKKIIEKYSNTISWLWVQEEPENMGAWNYIRDQFESIDIQPITREPSGSPAVGLYKIHQKEQTEIIGKVFRKCTCERNYKYCNLDCEVGGYRKQYKQPYYINY